MLFENCLDRMLGWTCCDGPVCIRYTFLNGIFCRSVSGLATGFPGGQWCFVLTTQPRNIDGFLEAFLLKYLRCLITICQISFHMQSKMYSSNLALTLYELYTETRSTFTGVNMRSLLQCNRYLHVKRDQTSIDVSHWEP